MVQLTNIVGSCEDFMVRQMSEGTCFQNLRLAQEYELRKLECVADNFILDNFTNLCSSVAFKELLMNEICRYLKDDQLNGLEIEIFRAAKEWLEFDLNRLRHITKVMQLINFKAIPAEMLADEVIEY